MPTIRRSADRREQCNSVHNITILLSTLSVTEDELRSKEPGAWEERQDILGGVDRYAYREQNRGSDVDSHEDWDGGSTVTSENSYQSEDGVFEPSSPPPPYPFMWVLVFVLLQLYPIITFLWLIDVFLRGLVLLALFIILKVLVLDLEQGQLHEWVTYQRHHVNLAFTRYMPR